MSSSLSSSSEIVTAKIVSMIDMASRDTTPDGEAVNALRLVRRDLAAKGIQFLDIIQLPLKKKDEREVIVSLQKKIDELESYINSLNNAGSQDLKKPNKDYYSWIDFVIAGTTKVGKTKGFQQIFMDMNPMYKQGDLLEWRRNNAVPAAAMKLTDNLKAATDFGRGKDWTDHEKNYLKELLHQEPRIRMKQLSYRLSRKFGRTITEGAAKAAKFRLLREES